MSDVNVENCFSCEKPLPQTVFFCGGCLTQFRCKVCNAPLIKYAIGCTECGEPIVSKKGNGHSANSSFNTISIHETANERTIQASFSDNVGKELTGIVRDAMSAKRVGIAPPGFIQSGNSTVEETVYQEITEHYPESQTTASFTDRSQSVFNSSNNGNQPVEQLPLLTVAMRALPASEREWVLVYACYASENGTKPFTRDDIINKYKESNRWDNQKSNGLTVNIQRNVQAHLLNAFGDKFSILDEGISAVAEILSRKKGTALVSKAKKGKDANDREADTPSDKKKPSATSTRVKRLTDLNFNPDEKDSLKAFISKYPVKSDLERILVFVYYMEEIIKLNGITYDHIYTAFDDLNIHTPSNVPQITRNCASQKGWIELKKSGIILTIKGRNQVRGWNKNA
ncbi:zinc ribbon domain-containing protein [Chitinophaga sp. CF418]|uniref:zinc ribbon domain-containing protein n=1 Tax=Chitinophaga sp. CF418 TaxID=1855287 RepID=UPI00091B6B55|nr:zinc ribbon domain-containing protein [Chitinophaga sp. CF418]SHN46084.1 hypothetical protein SAMN05216311_122111 [Chitinophaga sp. CF418]